MFSDLYDSISLWFSWQWPRAEAVIIAVHENIDGGSAGPVVVYEFSLADDGPYTGESPWFGSTVYINKLVGRKITVRYRKDDPAVNRLDDCRDL